jgi:hypothetical protein
VTRDGHHRQSRPARRADARSTSSGAREVGDALAQPRWLRGNTVYPIVKVAFTQPNRVRVVPLTGGAEFDDPSHDWRTTRAQDDTLHDLVKRTSTD